MPSTDLRPPPAGAAPAFPLVLIPLLVIACFAGSWIAWQFDPDVFAEEGVHEWIEAAVLLAGALAHGVRSRWGRAPDPGMLLRAGLAMLCLTFFLREVEIDDFGDPAVWRQVERFVRGVALALWAVLIVAGLRRLARRGRFLRAVAGELFARPWVLHGIVILAGLCLAGSWPFDKSRVPMDPAWSLFFEETLELSGYALLLAAAWVRPAAPR